jgi:xanthine dehydrogenase molybdenum-binding subunit
MEQTKKLHSQSAAASGEFSTIGKRLPRKDALEKVTGQYRCVADIQLPGMLHVRFLRSPHARARITGIDTSRAEALTGVKCVLTYQNVPKVHPRRKFEFLLDEVVNQVGQEVAAVAATTEETAEAGIGLINVQYEVLPHILEIDEAIKPDALLLHPEYGTNIYHGKSSHPIPRLRADGWLPAEFGDVEQGFAEADQIVEGIYQTQTQCHCSPAPRCVVCQWTGKELTCWADTQTPSLLSRDLAKCLDLPQSSIRVIATHAVGGYGGKDPEKTATLTALLSRRTGKPVKASFSREEDFIGTRCRPRYKAYEKIGVKKDGTITAIAHRMISNTGRDIINAIEVMSASAAATCSTLYPCPNVKFEGCVVMTNTPVGAGMIGFGDPEADFCVESMIDEAAEKIGMDPVEFRLKNCAKYGTRSATRRDVLGLSHDELESLPGPIRWGIVGPDFDSLQECLRRGAENIQWKKKWKGWKTPVEVTGSTRRGIGVAIGMHMSEYRLYAAIIKMNPDGTANVLSSAVEIGQGIRTAMAQVVAETLGIDFEDVSVLLGDTSSTPEGWGVVASGGTSSAITAAMHAAYDVKGQLFNIAAERLGVKPDALEITNRRIYVKASPETAISVAQACFIGYQVTGTAVNPPPDSIIDEKTGKVIKSYAGIAAFSEVEVDTETGELSVISLVSAHDCGRAINPTIVENQINMGITIGSGYARSEGLIIDQLSGTVLNPNLMDYKLMTILDMPKSSDLQGTFVEMPSAWGPFGAKGFSETGAVPIAPAVANAVYNAIGVRIREAPLTPEKIIEALGKSNAIR